MIKVLLIGETGSGKSTFINYLTNYLKHGTLHNLKIAIPSVFHPDVTEEFDHHEHVLHDQTQSKTDSCCQYMFDDGTNQYLFIDTPGLSDTRGHEQDKINLQKIIDAAENLNGLTAVIIVVNGAVSRLTINLQNVIAQLRGNLPDTVMDNVIVVLTNTSRYSTNFTLEALKLNGNVYPYYMQNSAFTTDPKKWTTTVIESLQYDWNQSMNEIKAMLATLNTFKTKSVAAFTNMKDIRNTIKQLMHAARIEVVRIQKMQDEIAMFEAGLKQANADTVTYKDYKKERVIDNIEFIDTRHHSTLCQSCNYVCHENCGLNEATVVGHQIFQHCMAIKDGNCTKCPRNCSYTDHYHAKKTVKITKKKVEDIIADIKSRYEAASDDSANYQKKIKSTADAKRLLENALKQKNEEIIAKCNELRRICSGFNLATELHALIAQLEIESAMLRNIETKQQAETFIRSLKQLCTEIERDQSEQHARRSQNPKMTVINTEPTIVSQTERSFQSTIVPSTSSSTQQTSNINSQSHVSEEILAKLREMARNPSRTRSKQRVRNISTNDTDSTSDENEQNEIDSSEDETTKSREPRSSSGRSTRMEPCVEEFKQLSTSELVTRYRVCDDHRTSNFIFHELTQRSYGKSMAPLTEPSAIAAFTTFVQKHCSLDHNALKYKYEQLKEQITAITEPDILQIEKVPLSLMCEIAAVYELLKTSSDTGRMTTPNASFPSRLTSPGDYQPWPSYAYLQQQPPIHHRDSPFVAPIPLYRYQSPYEYTHLSARVHYPEDAASEYISRLSLHPHISPNASFNYQPSHNVPKPYDHPSLNKSTHNMPTDGSENQHIQPFMHGHSEHFRHHNYGNPAYHPTLNSSVRNAPSSTSNPYHFLQDQHRYANENLISSNPTHHPLASSSIASSNHLSGECDIMRVTSPFRPVRSDVYRSSARSPTQRPLSSSSGFSESSTHAGSVVNLPFELTIEDLRKYTDAKLLSALDDASEKKNRSHQHIIYTELEQRCYGDHPLLIQEKRALFDEKCNKFREFSMADLRRFQLKMQQDIYNHLINGNATNLTNVPSELIIEIAAVNYCIRMFNDQ
ncbi:hypothetical protein I4U23_003544 [Adineta vaga]|nr:hypothetical protein I4U23_003544 [Adineta vaga]